jgi:aminoglycoside 6'-N-acetyltransferase
VAGSGRRPGGAAPARGWLIRERGHHRLTIDPAAANEQAIRAYTKVGFRPVGFMRRYQRTGDDWEDGLLMDLLADELTSD